MVKYLLITVGLLLYVSNPWRDLFFYETISANEGFESIASTYIIAFGYQLIATFTFLPLALFLIVYGVDGASKITLIPEKKRFTWIWGTVSIVLGFLMLLIEGKVLFYCFFRPHHWKTALITSSYISFILIWMSCSMSHKILIDDFIEFE